MNFKKLKEEQERLEKMKKFFEEREEERKAISETFERKYKVEVILGEKTTDEKVDYIINNWIKK
jgi:hypothetical protein